MANQQIHIAQFTEQSSTPATPGAGNRKLYPRDDGWYEVDSAGNDIRASANIGVGVIKTISTGVVAVGVDRNIIVAAESGVSDTLDEITGLSVGESVWLRADTGDTITVTHNAGAATVKIHLSGNSDATLDEQNPLELTLVATNVLAQITNSGASIGKLELVEEKVIATAVTTTTFSSLTGDDSYVLEMRQVDDSGSPANWSIRINGDSDSTDYVSQSLFVGSTTVSGSRTANASTISYVSASTETFCIANLGLSDGRFFCHSNLAAYNSSDIVELGEYSVAKNTDGVSSITAIEIIASQTNGIGVDSVLRLYRRIT